MKVVLLYVCGRESDFLCDVLNIYSTGSVVVRKCRRYFSHGCLSSMAAIYKCVEEQRATGPFTDRKRTRRRRVLMKADETDVKSVNCSKNRGSICTANGRVHYQHEMQQSSCICIHIRQTGFTISRTWIVKQE
jgi:hypothetical protein